MITNPTIGMPVQCACSLCSTGRLYISFHGTIVDIEENRVSVQWSIGGISSSVSLDDLESLALTPEEEAKKVDQNRRKAHADKFL